MFIKVSAVLLYIYINSQTYYVYTKGYNNNPLTIHANAKISSPCNIPFFLKYFSWPFFLSDFLGWFHSLCILCIHAFADSSFIVYGHIYIFAICISHSKVSDFAPTVSYPSSAGAAFRIFEGKKGRKRERIFRSYRDGKDKINMIQVTQNGGTNVIIEFCFSPPLAVCWFQ